MSTSVNAIPVGTAKLASEVSNVASQNMIVVGGPCANSVAATLMNRAQSWPACGEGFEEGKAIIKLYENGNRVAMLVAGATALDTRRASRVLADHTAYSLSGMEMQVVGTSTTFSDTVVSAVTQSIDDMEEEEEMEDEAMDDEETME
jgi:malate/lactate dehydrogenase